MHFQFRLIMKKALFQTNVHSIDEFGGNDSLPLRMSILKNPNMLRLIMMKT